MKAYRIPLEREEQAALIQWADYTPWVGNDLIAIPNGGSRHPAEARNLKRQGVRAGVSDLFYARPKIYCECTCGRCRYGLWLEAKRVNVKSIPEHQLEFMERMRKNGYEAKVFRGVEEGIEIVTNYCSGNL